MVNVDSSNSSSNDQQADVVICMEEEEHDDEVEIIYSSTQPVGKKEDDRKPATMGATTSTPRSSSTTNAVTPGTTTSSTRGSDSFVISDSRSSSYENHNTTTATVISSNNIDNNGPNHFTFAETTKPLISSVTTTIHHQLQQHNDTIDSYIPITIVSTTTAHRSRSPVTTSRRGGRSSPVTTVVRSSPPPLTVRHNTRSATPVVNFISGDATPRLHSLPAPSAAARTSVSASGGRLTPNNYTTTSTSTTTTTNNNNMHGYGDAPSSVAAAAAAAAAAATKSGRYYVDGPHQQLRATSKSPGLRNSNGYAERPTSGVMKEDKQYQMSSHLVGAYSSQQHHHQQQRPSSSAAIVNEYQKQQQQRHYSQQQQQQHQGQQQPPPPFARSGAGEARDNTTTMMMRHKQQQQQPEAGNPSPPPMYGHIHTFSHSGSLRGSGDLQEQERFPSRSYDNYPIGSNATIANASTRGHHQHHHQHHPQDHYSSTNSTTTIPSHYHQHQHHQGYTSNNNNRSPPNILVQDHIANNESHYNNRDINNNNNEMASSRASPNFTIYHNPTPRQAVPPFTNKGGETVVLGVGSTPIHITHNSHGIMKNYESKHGVGRSVNGRNSARSVFRNTSQYSPPSSYPDGETHSSRAPPTTTRPSSYTPPHQQQQHHPQHKQHQHQHQQEHNHRYREDSNSNTHKKLKQETSSLMFISNDDNTRNAPSPSSGGVGTGAEFSSLLTPSRQQMMNSNDDLLGMATPSILDLPEDSPQRILLSFRTPSMSASQSFDWKDGTNTKARYNNTKCSDDEDDDNNNNVTNAFVLLSPPVNQRVTQQRSDAKRGGAVNYSSNNNSTSTSTNKTPTASPNTTTSNKSPLDSSFSLSALPSPPHYTNSNGDQIEMANSFSLFNPSSFDSLGEECTQLVRKRGDKQDDIINLSQFGPAESVGDHVKRCSPNNNNNNNCVVNASFSLAVDISMGIGTMPTVGMSRSNSDSMSLIDFGPMASRTGSFGERRSSLRASSIDGYEDGLQSSPQVVHQYSSSQPQQQHQQQFHQLSSLTKGNNHPWSHSPTKNVVRCNSKAAATHIDHNDNVNGAPLITRSNANSNRSNSYGSHHSSGTTGSGPNIMYPDICIVTGAAPIPGFYYALIRMRNAFEEFSFLLPGLKMALERDRSGLVADVVLAPDTDASVPELLKLPSQSESEMVIAKRRVISAVCAFGGSRCKSKLKHVDAARGRNIFRNVGGCDSTKKIDVVTGRTHEYDENFSKRYYENENRISWAYEETPPVISSDEELFLREQQHQHQLNGGESTSPRKPGSGAIDHDERHDRSDSDLKSAASSPTKRDSASSPSKNSGQPKMRYRCKLCGQPKQNHICAYQQSLQRSIGISVYPNVNAFTADEPGRLAPSLTEMNNFVCENGDGSPDRPTPNASSLAATPMRSKGAVATPLDINSPSTFYSTPFRSKTGVIVKTNMSTPFGTISNNDATSSRFSESKGISANHHHASDPINTLSRKRHIGQVSASSSSDEALFVKPMELRPEQYRTVTPRTVSSRSCSNSNSAMDHGSYCYPQLPLPYKQRKSLSDNLFSLSKEVQHLTDECAVVLKEAREKDMWDLAVSELMTQVITVLHCPVGDSGFEGLKNYLLTLGIAC